MLQGPTPCTIVCDYLLCINYETETWLLVSSSFSGKQQMCFVHGQGQKRPKTYNKESCRAP